MSHPPPIQQQPGAPMPPAPPGYQPPSWMEKPAGALDSPPGLEYLGAIDRIQIRQQRELAEIVLGWETNNKYIIYNGIGQQVYYAYEESGCCTRQCCGSQRGFVIHVVDNFNQEVLRITREFNCCAGCCWCAVAGSCCSHEVLVESPSTGQVIGRVQQSAAACSNAYVIVDHDGKEVLDVPGPCCCMMCGCQDKVFPVQTKSGVEIGEVRKQWSGLIQEAFTDADNFGVSFPLDMAIRTKAALIGATFLIDFMNFEDTQSRNGRGRHNGPSRHSE